MIKEDENISENVKQRYLDYLRKREEIHKGKRSNREHN